MNSAASPLTGDELVLRRVSLSAQQATELRRYASRNGWPMPVSPYERDLYPVEGLEPPAVEMARRDVSAPNSAPTAPPSEPPAPI